VSRFRINRLLKALKRAKPRVVALLPKEFIQPGRAEIVPPGESLLSQTSRFESISYRGTNVM